jgi:serine/threonine-protein kinase RsbW
MKLASRESPPALSLTISSRMAEADSLCLKIRALIESQGLRQACFPVELLARECLSNAMIHGNQLNADKSVLVRLWIEQRWVRLQVTDQGPGFDWRKLCCSAPDDTESHGRGLRICASYAERVRFNRRGNQITLWIQKNPKRKDDGNGRLRH